MDSLTSITETSENVIFFAFISLLVSFGICIYVKQFFDSKTEISTRVIQKKSKSSSKEYVTGKRFNFWSMGNTFRKL